MYLITINLLIEFHKKKIKINIFDIDSFNNSLLNPLIYIRIFSNHFPVLAHHTINRAI